MDLLRWHFSEDFDVSRWGRHGGLYSSDDRYRWTLCRRWRRDGDVVCWIGLNPGTSDDRIPLNRPILRKMVNMSRSWGMNGLILVNLFAWPTSDPRCLRAAARSGLDIIGAQNDAAIEAATQVSALTIASWGNVGVLQDRAEKVGHIIRNIKCLKMTKRNHPWHPRFVTPVDTVRQLLDFQY